jgi:ABC-2 type transport system permease protein
MGRRLVRGTADGGMSPVSGGAGAPAFDQGRYLAEHAGVEVAHAFAVAATIFAGILALRSSAELTSISITQFAAQCLRLALLAIAFGGLVIGIGAATGRLILVFTVTAVIGVLAYALHAFALQFGIADAAYLSPFHYYIGGEPLRHGMQWADAAVRLGAGLLPVAAGVLWFNRRDLNT